MKKAEIIEAEACPDNILFGDMIRLLFALHSLLLLSPLDLEVSFRWPYCRNGYSRIFREKAIIRARFLSEKGSDYMDLVGLQGFEPGTNRL